MVAPTIFRSTDAGAPTLTGQAGSLIALLDACLVNGYGSQAAAGWTKPYTGTNTAAFRMGAGGTAERMYLRVDDAGTMSARLTAFVTMSSVDAGTEQFPPELSFAGGVYYWKSATANSTQRPWILLATPQCFYLFSEGSQTVFGASSNVSHGAMFFGEFKYIGTGFTHNVRLIGQGVEQNSEARVGHRLNPQGLADSAISMGPRSYTNLASPVRMVNAVHQHYNNTNFTVDVVPIGMGGLSLAPSAVDGSIRFAPVEILVAQPNWAHIGFMPGMWGPILNSLLPTFVLIEGAGELAGRTLMMVRTYAGSSSTWFAAQIGFDITDW